jgi:acyl-CoA synthetase (AMP-forming)/AMP-acid ligase II
MATGVRGDLELETIPRLVHMAAARHGDAAAIVDGDVTLSYRGLEAAAARAARGLLALGVTPGARVAIWAPNCWEWIVAALGVHAVGAALVPINTRWKGAEAAYVLEASGARLLFTVTGFLGADYLGELRAAGVALPTVVLRGEAPAGTRAFAELLDAPAAALPAVRPDAACDILFTSGTTGRPKGVAGTHAQALRAFRDWGHLVGLRAGDRYLVVVPFFHTFGYKAGWLAAFMAGATVFPHAVFDAGAVLARVARDRITVLPGPPTLYQTMLAHPDLGATDRSSLRLAVTGAAVIPVELVVRMRRELGFTSVITGYGLTEATGIVTMCRKGDDPETIARTSGRAIPGVEVRIAEDGEILVRGYNVCRYLDGDSPVDADGWLATGDIGALDARGYLTITDRRKDMFIVGGFNAYPAEIEGVLAGHQAVAQAAVVGAPDERLGEVGVAFVIPRPGAHVDGEALIGWCRERMANYKVPRRVEVVDALPMNASGKVLKYELRERARWFMVAKR